MRRFLFHITVGLFLCAWFSTAAQKGNEDVCVLDGNRIIFRLNRTWNEAKKKEIMNQFDIDSALYVMAFSGKNVFSYHSEEWTVRVVDRNRIELSKPLGPAGTLDKGDIYMLDDRWINAEGLKERESASFGVNVFSLHTVFSYHDGQAKFFLPGRKYAGSVYLAGTFNNWSTMQTPMIRCDSGWFITLGLKPGKYAYKYIIDGKWSQDPYNKLKENDLQGGENSIVFCYNYRFFLKYYKGSKNVFVAGSFNGWNPYILRMFPVRGGWARNMYLREGTHAYKFIVDGEWILDPENNVTRPDGSGHENSFMSIGDTMYFRLKDHTAIRKVILSGSFNAWNQEELSMQKTKEGWTLPYVLAPGNYEYKFILDGRWITDPDNPVTVGSGSTMNSFFSVSPNHTFTLDNYPLARKVIVTGSFNGWRNDSYEMQIKGTQWYFSMYLKPGKHTYKFIVDGKWIIDPANELWEKNEYGTGNSVLWIEP